MKLPVGLESQIYKVYFVASDTAPDIGYWMLSTKNRLFGEGKYLETVKETVQKFEANLNWLALDIVDANYNQLKNEILQSNPNNLSADELEEFGKDIEAQRLEIEIYVKSLIRQYKLQHLIIKQYKERVTQTLMSNKAYEYTTHVAFAALKYRYVDADNIKVDDKNPRLATIAANDIKTGKAIVGIPDLQFDDLNSPLITEPLVAEIYTFANLEHNGLDYLDITAPSPEQSNQDEKKLVEPS